MKYLILALAYTWSFSSFAAFVCNKAVDPKRVVLFVDTNNSKLESENAAKAACERGETFKEIPVGNEYMTPSVFDREIKALARNNIAVASMVISGHDGGGSFHGTRGGIDKLDVVETMGNAYRGKPELLNQFSSLMMWGCWTMGPSEVDFWRKSMPSLKIAAGFFDMGPLNTTLASRTILRDLLVKEKEISLEADHKKLKQLLDGVENINYTWASVYVNGACSAGAPNYYYITEGADLDYNDPKLKRGKHFVNYESSFTCEDKAETIRKHTETILAYYEGRKPLPESSSAPEIVSIYSFSRSFAQCLADDSVLNGDRLLMLRFFKDVKNNFALSFSDEINKAQNEFKALGDYLGSVTPTPGTPLAKLKNYFNNGKSKFFKPDGATLKNKDRAQIRQMISFLDGLIKEAPSALQNRGANLKRLKNAMQTYLYEMNPNCVNALRWHEYDPNSPAPYYCDI